MLYYITLLDASDHLAAFLLNTPNVSDDGFYRQGLSIDAFRNNQHKRREKNKYWFYVDFERDQHGNLGNIKYHKDIGIPVSKSFTSVWDFYTFIGYEYKKKKYKYALADLVKKLVL
jgi:hypothetical protein